MSKIQKMPYPPLREGYFEEFNASTMLRIADQERERRGWRILLTASTTVAATIAIVLGYTLFESPTQRAMDRVDSSLGSYVGQLSDDELDTYYSRYEEEEEFYANLF